MRLVVDTNIIISSLLKESMSRRIIMLPELDLYTPEYVNIEIERHSDRIRKSTGLPDHEFNLLMSQILSGMTVIPLEEFKDNLKPAYEVMKDIDPEDTAFLALAMSLDCDGIWTNDSDFDKQDLVKVWKTHMLKKHI